MEKFIKANVIYIFFCCCKGLTYGLISVKTCTVHFLNQAYIQMVKILEKHILIVMNMECCNGYAFRVLIAPWYFAFLWEISIQNQHSYPDVLYHLN